MTNISEMFNLVNRYTGEYTDERIPNTDRFSALTEATATIKQKMKGDMSNMTYPINFIPDVFYYKIDKTTYNVLAAANIRVSENDRTGAKFDVPFERSSSDKINEDISRGFYNNTYALDRYDGDMYLVLSYKPHANKKSVPTYDDLNNVTLTGDALNLSIDSNETISGSSLKFNIDYTGILPISESSVVVPFSSTINIKDLRFTSTMVWSFWVEDPEKLTSVSLKLKSGVSDYVLFSAVEPFNYSSFKQGWNRVVVPYASAVEVGTPDLENINEYEFTFEYELGFAFNTIRVDDLYIANPTKLNFHYLSYSVGKDFNGNEIDKFTLETDIPYFSGQYDNFKYTVARYAASYLLFDLRRYDDALVQEREADKRIDEVMNLIPSSHTVETKSFRPHGINFRRRRTLRNIIR